MSAEPDRRESYNTYVFLPRPPSIEGVELNHDGSYASVKKEEDWITKSYSGTSAAQVVENLNQLDDADIPYPTHYLWEECDEEQDTKELFVRMGAYEPLETVPHRAQKFVSEIQNLGERAARAGYRIDLRLQNFGVSPEGHLVYFDTADKSSIKKDSNPRQWMGKFMEKGTEQLPDDVPPELIEDLNQVIDHFKP